jgi:hypothetical protein
MHLNSDTPLDIPERYEDVTAEWLTKTLRAGGVLDQQEGKQPDEKRLLQMLLPWIY